MKFVEIEHQLIDLEQVSHVTPYVPTRQEIEGYTVILKNGTKLYFSVSGYEELKESLFELQGDEK